MNRMMNNLFKKKSLFFVLTAMIALLIGCSNDSGSSEGSGGNQLIPIYTPPSGGTVYTIQAGAAQIFKQEELMPEYNFSIQAIPQEDAAILKVIEGYEKGEIVFTAQTSSAVDAAYKGEHNKIDGKHDYLRAVGYTDGSPVHLVVPANSEIQSYEDLKGKSIGVAPGSVTEQMIRDVLGEAYGYEEGEDYTLLPLNPNEVMEGIQNESIDSGVLMGSTPSPQVRQLESQADIRILSLNEKEVDAYLKLNPNGIITTIEADTYSNQPEEIQLFFNGAVLFTHEDTPEDLVYNYLKVFLDYQEDMGKVHPAAAYINEDTILDGFELPLHPGAEKLLKEKGIIE